MIDKVIIGKITLSLCLTAVGAAAGLLPTRKPIEYSKSSNLTLCSLLLAVRLAVFLLVFVVFRFDPQSDVIGYDSMASRANQGHVPGESNELPLHYGPLFLTLIGFFLKIWNDPKVLILFEIFAEFVLLVVWLFLGPIIANCQTMQRAALLYIFCPLSVISTAVDGNNDALGGMFVSLFVAFTLRHRPGLGGFVAGLSVVVSKAITAVVGLPVFLASERKPIWLVAAAVPVVSVYGVWALLLSIDVVAGFRFHAIHYSSGNLPFWVGLFGPDLLVAPGRWFVNVLGLLFILMVACLPLWAHRSFGHGDVVPIMAALTVALMIVSAKSFPHYMLCALFPVLLIIAKMNLKSGIVLYCLFSLSTAIESTLWFRLLNGRSPAIIRELAPSNLSSVLFFGAIETLLLVTYGAILWLCTEAYWRVIWTRARGRTGPA